MHIVIGLITAVAGLLWALSSLQRSGFDLGGFNPFSWYRRAQWQRKYPEKPIYALESPMDVAALLLYGTAKCEGALSAEQKQALLNLYETEFHQDPDEAADLLLASSHLMRDEVYLVDNLPKILERSREHFTPEQIDSMITLMCRVSQLEGEPNQEQRKLIEATEKYFRDHQRSKGGWR